MANIGGNQLYLERGEAGLTRQERSTHACEGRFLSLSVEGRNFG